MTDSLTTLIERHDVRAEVIGSATEPAGWDQPTQDYRIELRKGHHRLQVNFYTGTGWKREPNVNDVLEALISDAATVENASSFEEWAEELGFDTDSRKAEATYRKTVAQTEELRRFLGDDFDTFVWSER